jgi:predicted NBD/HSP70 family sugar kinase
MPAAKAEKRLPAPDRFAKLSRDEKALLERLLWYGEHSRGELVGATGFSLTKINSLLENLTLQTWLEEGGVRESNGGRPSATLRLTAKDTYLLGVDLGAHGAHVLLADTAMNLVARKNLAINVLAGPDRVYSHILKALAAILDLRKVGRDQVLAIGVGIPGPVDPVRHTPVQPPLMASWENFDLAAALTDQFAVPTFVDNDVNVMALGELWNSRRRFLAEGRETPNPEDWLLVKLGTGIGSAIVIHGRLYRGASGGAGEIGHICVDPAGPICRCGQRGCLEAVYGAAGVERAGTAAAKQGISPLLSRILREKGFISSVDVSRAAKEGDGYASAIVQEMGTKLGTVLAGFVDLLNPQKLLIGGGLTDIDPRLLASIQQGIYGRAMPLMTRSLVVERTSLGADAGIFGSVALAFTEMLACENS